MLKEIATTAVVPSRRLPAPLYAALQIVVAAPTALAYSHVCQQADNASSGMQALVLVMIWMNFCVVANRFHDGGVTCLWVIPLFLLGTGIYLMDLDPVMLGTDWATHDLWSGRLDFAKRVFALMGCGTVAMAMVVPSSDERNRFGMPFGEKDWTLAEHFIADAASGPKFVRAKRAGVASEQVVDTVTQTRAMRETLKSTKPGRAFSRRG